MRSEAPYRAPQRVDFPRLKAIFIAKPSAAEVHIWSLREDLSHFVKTLKDTMDDRYEHVKPISGGPHNNLHPTRNHLIWGLVIANVVSSGDYYPEISSKPYELADEHEDISTTRDSKQELSEDEVCQLTYFRVFLKHAIQGPLTQLKAGFHSNLHLKPYFERVIGDNDRAGKTGICRLSLKDNSPLVKAKSGPEDTLLWLMELLVDEGLKTPFGIVNVVDELGRLLQAESKGRGLVSPHIAHVVSDLAVLTEALRRLEVYKGKLKATPEMEHGMIVVE